MLWTHHIQEREYYRANLACFDETQTRILNPLLQSEYLRDLCDLKMKIINRLS